MEFNPRRSLPLSAAVLLFAVGWSWTNTAIRTKPGDYDRFSSANDFVDVKGHRFTATDLKKNQATVFVFGSTQCPISNLYTPRLAEIAGKYQGRGVELFLIDSNSDDSLASLQHYATSRKLPFPVVKDAGASMADWLSASCTPEAVIVDPNGEVRYRGRIDDNVDRSKVIHSDVREALDALLAGKPVVRPRTLAKGCAIFRDNPTLAGNPVSGSSPTYGHDVAKILAKDCVACHRAGASAPFSLENYQEARTWAIAIKGYTARRIMPPWKAIAGYGDFHDERTLTDSEISSLARWANAGAPKGNLAEAPHLAKLPDAKAWSLGTPDTILKPIRPYHLAAEGPDVYRNFVLPIDFKEDRYLSAIEFKPGNPAIVHHIVLYIDPNQRSVAMDGKESEPGYTVPGTDPGFDDAVWGEVWTPGRTSRFYPAGIAFMVPKGAKLVMQVHYHKNGAVQEDDSQVALYNAHGRVDQLFYTSLLLNPTFDLTPGDSHQLVPIDHTTGIGLHLRSIFPHMHLLGREMHATATLPDGEKKELVLIKDWDFNWQQTYNYKDAIELPKGTKLKIDTYYDNSSTNPRQTNHPPKEVHWGEQTTDEMCICVLGLTIDSQALGLNIIDGHISK